MVGGVSLQLPLPKAKDFHRSRGCESCEFIAQLLQHPEFCMYDSLDGRSVVKYWDKLPSKKKRCEGCTEFEEATRVPLLRRKMQLDVHADGSSQSSEVVRVDCARTLVGPDIRQVEDLKCEYAGVRWEGTSDGEIE